jgi:hypothetical protein
MRGEQTAVAKAIAYYSNVASITAVKSFKEHALVANVI